MMRDTNALANKLEAKDSRYGTASAFARADRNMSAYLREIEGMPAPDEAAHPRAQHHKIEHPLRTFVATDAIALLLSFVGSWLLAFKTDRIFSQTHSFVFSSSGDVMFVAQFLGLGAGLLLWFAHTSHYQLRMPFWMEAKKIVEAVCFTMLISCFLQFVSKEHFSRLWTFSFWAFSILSIISFRSIWRAILRRRGEWQIPTLLIGDGPTAEEAQAALNSEPSLGYDLVAHIRELPPVFQSAGHSWKTLCKLYNADYVVIALDGEDFINARQSLAQLMREHIPFSVSPPMQNLSVFGMTPQSFLGHDVLLLTRNSGLDRPLPRFLKRTFDIGVAATTLFLLSPLIALIALVVKLDGGPALYHHKRVGLRGEVFSCLKFRSMCVKSDDVLEDYLARYPLARAEWQRDHKLRNDPRITPVGAILRRTSLDELPQLVNVLTGDMSIVGPRPIIDEEAEKYKHDIAFYYRVRPGITGLWQVSGRNNVSYTERVRMDSWYVRNWSLWHDIAIICKTFNAVIKQRGAY